MTPKSKAALPRAMEMVNHSLGLTPTCQPTCRHMRQPNEKEQNIFFYDGNENKDVVRIEDWLDAEGPVMEWALNLRSEVSC